jgi:leader peptidase (prepilin peptidase) / N-methyltransferase
MLLTLLAAAGLATGWAIGPTITRTVDRPVSNAARAALAAATACAILIAARTAIGTPTLGLTYLPGLTVWAWLLIAITGTDLAAHRIPNAITYPAIPAVVLLLTAGALVAGDTATATRVLIGATVAFLVMLTIALVNPRGMGMGDVKATPILAAGLALLGYGPVAIGLFAGFLIAAVVSVAAIATRRRSRADQIPFGPYLCGGALIGLVVGPQLTAAYLRASGLA